MIADLAAMPVQEGERAALVVVGAGAVGLALAITMARAGQDVVVLEAGGRHLKVDYQRDNQSVGAGVPHRGRIDGRVRALGGTTRLWGGQLVPFSAGDLAGDPKGGRPKWPIDYDALVPFYDQAYDLLKVPSATRQVATAWREKINAMAGLGTELESIVNLWLPKPDFSQLFASEMRDLPTLRVYTGAEVTRLSFSPDGTRVVGVSVLAADGRVREVSAERIVLAAGTLENARLLLSTAKSQPACGFADNPALGRGFVDHLHGIAGRMVVTDPKRVRDLFDNARAHGAKLSIKLRASDQHRHAHGLANCAVTLNASVGIRDMLRDFAGLLGRMRGDGGGFAALRQAFGSARVLLPFAIRYLMTRRSGALTSRDVLIGLEVEQLPTPNSYLYLADPTNPEQSPIGVHWDFDGREMAAAIAMLHQVKAFFESRGLGIVTINPDFASGDVRRLRDLHDANHHIGGACMAPDAATGVVDPDLAVFGVPNLFVLGAATFPSGSFANPTLTALAFAMRLAEHLRKARA